MPRERGSRPGSSPLLADDFTTHLGERGKLCLCHCLRPLASQESSHSSLEGHLSKSGAAAPQVFGVAQPELLPQPPPKAFDRVEIRRARGDVDESDVLLGVDGFSNSHLQALKILGLPD